MESSIVTWAGATVAFRRLDERDNSSELSTSEQALVRAAGSERRRAEILAGRTAAHIAFAAAGVRPVPEIRSWSDGRPQVYPANGWHVSLAHDGKLAAAACAQTPVGIDLVHLGRKAQLERVLRSAQTLEVAQHELLVIADGVLPWPAQAVCWSGWEALGKQSGDGILGGAMRIRLQLKVQGEVAMASVGSSRLRWWGEQDHVCCLAALLP